MQTLWLVRHEHRLDFDRPEWFDTARYRYDPPLADRGVDRAKLLAAKLTEVSIDKIYTSPFLRTIQTADPIARSVRLPIRLEWGLCEWLCKDWTTELPETTPVDELVRSHPNIDLAYRSLVTPHYPETMEELDTRINNIADKLITDNWECGLAIAHKGSVLGIAAALTGAAEWRSYNLPCGGIIKLVREDGDRWESSIIEW
jgi:broad specificity phosphatase PhoE